MGAACNFIAHGYFLPNLSQFGRNSIGRLMWKILIPTICFLSLFFSTKWWKILEHVWWPVFKTVFLILKTKKKKKKLMSPTQKILFGNMFSENLHVEQAIHTSTKNSHSTGQSLHVRLFLVHYGRMHKSNLPGCLFS